jgi:hypothetical protein
MRASARARIGNIENVFEVKFPGLNDTQPNGVRFPTGTKDFSLHHNVDSGSGTHAASYSMSNGALSSRLKRLERKAYHLPPCNAVVKNAWSCASIYSCVCIA